MEILGGGGAYARYAFPWIRAWATINRETWLLIANNDVSKTNISGASGSDCVYSLDLNIMYMTALWLILMRLLYLHVVDWFVFHTVKAITAAMKDRIHFRMYDYHEPKFYHSSSSQEYKNHVKKILFLILFVPIHINPFKK